MDSSLAEELFGPRDAFAGQARYQRVKSALTLIGFGKSKLYALVRQGRIRAVKLDGATFIDLGSVAALFAKCPEIAPERHNTLTADQLGLTDAELPVEGSSNTEALTLIKLKESDLVRMEGEDHV
ncbi:hypothetical protein ACVWWO_006447 [Bradyrhizobium sp. F1.13.1]